MKQFQIDLEGQKIDYLGLLKESNAVTKVVKNDKLVDMMASFEVRLEKSVKDTSTYSS